MNCESDYTLPRSDCPHPEYWHAPDSMATEDEVTRLLAALVVALQPELVVETGTWLGHTAAAIGEALVGNGHGKLITIEADLKLVEQLADTDQPLLPVTVVHADSHQWTPPGPIDLLWLDGSEDRAAEWRNLGPHLSDRGVVVVHDTGPQGAVRATFDGLDELTLVHLPTPRGVSIGRRR